MHLTLPNDTGQLEYPVSYGRLPVIDMRNNAEIPDKRLPGKTGQQPECPFYITRDIICLCMPYGKLSFGDYIGKY